MVMEFVKSAEELDELEEKKTIEPNDTDKSNDETPTDTRVDEKGTKMVVPGSIHDIDKHAKEQGHKSYEQFIAEGGDPADYQTPEQFVALKGPLKRIKEQSRHIKRMEQEFNDRLNSLNKFHEAQLEAQKAQLIAQRDAAIDNYDAPTARQYQTQIDQLQQPVHQQPQQPVMSQVLQEWNSDPKNDWFKTDRAKSAFASIQFEEYRAQGHDDATAIRLMESDVARRFRDVNTNITGAPAMERGSKPGTKPAPKKLSMDDLTMDELSVWKHSGKMWPSQAAFLKSVQDSRGAEQ